MHSHLLGDAETFQVTWQLGLVEREIQDVLDGKYSFTVQPKSTLEKPEDEPKNEGEILQRPICPGDICAICQDELLTEQRHPVTYCRNGCGNSVHIRCMRVWTDHQRKQKSINLSENVPCPICREEFGQLGMLLREITENIHPREAKPENRRAVVVAPTVQSIQSTVRTYHPSTTCLSCGTSPVYGNIYRCQLCDEKLDQLGSTFMCAPCYRQGKHPEHDAFMYREAPNGKWFAVAVNRCIPHNLSHTLKSKNNIPIDPDEVLLSPRRIRFSDDVETLRLTDLSRLPHWTIRQPRNRSVRIDQLQNRKTTERKLRNSGGDFVSQLVETAKMGRFEGSHARLDNWGSIMTTGLLTPGRQCRICLMAFRMGDMVRRLMPGCEHIFHTTCIDPWLLHQSATCPLDGSRIIPMNTGSNLITKTGNVSMKGVFGENQSNLDRFSDLKVHANALCVRPVKQNTTASGRTHLDAKKTSLKHTQSFDGLTVIGQSAASGSSRSAKSSCAPVSPDPQ